MLRRALVPGIDQVPRDIDPQHVCAEFCLRQSGRAIAPPAMQHLETFRYTESLNQRLSAFAHGIGNAREIAFFPQCFVRICGSIHNMSLPVGFLWSQLFRPVTNHNNPASRKRSSWCWRNRAKADGTEMTLAFQPRT